MHAVRCEEALLLVRDLVRVLGPGCVTMLATKAIARTLMVVQATCSPREDGSSSTSSDGGSRVHTVRGVLVYVCVWIPVCAADALYVSVSRVREDASGHGRLV